LSAELRGEPPVVVGEALGLERAPDADAHVVEVHGLRTKR